MDPTIEKFLRPLVNPVVTRLTAEAQKGIQESPDAQAAIEAAKESYATWQWLKWVLAAAGVTIYAFYFLPRFQIPRFKR